MDIKEIIYSIEFSFVGMYEQVDGLMNVYKPKGNHIIQFPQVDFWEFNRAGMTRLNEESADNAIKEMLEYYNKLGSKSIGWVTGPLTTPSNFSEYLEKNYFFYKESVWGMYLPIEAQLHIQNIENLEIKEATLADLEREDIQIMIEKAYGMPEGSATLLRQMVEFYQKITDVSVYIGYDGSKPIAFGNLIAIPGTKGAVLGGSATLPEYRKKGLYSNMLKIRKDKAKKIGIEYLVIQAKEATSGPIAKKHGFEKICTFKIFVFNPSN